MDKKNINQGFTLLEMSVVIFIIGVLLLLTIPNINKVLNSVSDKGCKAQLKVVDSAIVQYKLEFSEEVTIEQLVSQGYLSNEQLKCSNGQSIGISNGQAYSQ